MKLLVVLLALLFGVWLWRRGHRIRHAERQAPPRQQLSTEPMVACAQCGLHVPRSASVPGHRGNYCCTAHRRQAEGS